MLKDFQLTSYDYYSNRRDMEIISSLVAEEKVSRSELIEFIDKLKEGDK